MPRQRELDRVLLATALLLAVIGVVMVASASAPVAREVYRLPAFDFALRQAVAVVLGVVAMFVAAFVPLEMLFRPAFAWTSLGLTWIALLIPYFQPRVAGTHRWLQLFGFSLQPSAFAKVVLPLALASWVAWCREQQWSPKLTFYSALGITGVTVLLVEDDLGSVALVLATALTVLLLANMPLRFLAGVGAGAALVIALAVIAKPYRIERVRAFLGKPSYQVQQSLIAIGGGGPLGRGLGESTQKLFFLPQPHTDFIFAVVGEETGLWGSTLVLVLLGLVAARGLRAAWQAPTLPAALLAAGVAVSFAVQALINVSVCLNLVPTKGLPLPLLSAGGSDVLATLLAIGVLLNVGKEGV